MRFRDRTDAGRRLAQALDRFRGQPGVVYALPRGGVPLGAEVARHLDMPLDLLIPRKIGHPFHPEYAICAVPEQGERVCNRREEERIDPEWLEHAEARARAEARRRRELYCTTPAPDVAGRLAIIVDDGIATGLTMRAAIRDARLRRPSQIVVAIPVAPADTAELLEAEVDHVVTLDRPVYYRGSVGSYYESFEQTSDDEVIDLLATAHRTRKPDVSR
ncbi:phosphoribosyltransferase [Thioalkalivibrio sp. HL-Eb18]|uniref:phosphoribosyltransferase n=1 Tax=Thioalkalivibrio sp. HL-Eb18 TaxID=1266913 RepID=UPI00036D03D6|nr:phosphoribosyltransferase family protein [Thioalkalivibrio sp. HL-Eb18]